MEVTGKVVLPSCCHCVCLKCYEEWHRRSQSCPFCQDNLKRVKSGNIWIYTDACNVVDSETNFKENRKRLFLYVEMLPLIVPDPVYKSYDPCRR